MTAIPVGGVGAVALDSIYDTQGSGQPVVGGMDWADAPRRCTQVTKAGAACPNPPLDDDDVCVGHRRAREAAARNAFLERAEEDS